MVLQSAQPLAWKSSVSSFQVLPEACTYQSQYSSSVGHGLSGSAENGTPIAL